MKIAPVTGPSRLLPAALYAGSLGSAAQAAEPQPRVAQIVSIEQLGGTSLQPGCAIQDLRVEPCAAQADQPVTITVTTAPDAAQTLQLTNAYYVDRAESLPGFYYNAEKKKSLRGSRPIAAAPGRATRPDSAWAPKCLVNVDSPLSPRTINPVG